MKKILSFSLLAGVLSFSLTGCGGGGDEAGGGGGGSSDQYTPAQGDYISQSAIPYLQNQYGSIQTFDRIEIFPNRFLEPGTYTWAQIYSPYILEMVSRCGCSLQSQGNQQQNNYYGNYNNNSYNNGQALSGLASVDWEQFQYQMMPTRIQNGWVTARIRLSNPRSSYTPNFLWVMNILMSAGYSYTQNVMPQANTQYYYYGTPYYNYYPQNSAQFSYNNGKVQFGLQGSF